ncbi:hypothetical protein [Bacillus pumilus]|nr:hypothetical protein [Bacillus pumilus]
MAGVWRKLRYKSHGVMVVKIRKEGVGDDKDNVDENDGVVYKSDG